MKQIIVGVIGYHQSGKTTLLKNLSCASKLITAPPLPLNNKSNIAHVPYFTSAFSKIATFFPLAKKVYPQIKFCEIDCYDEEQKWKKDAISLLRRTDYLCLVVSDFLQKKIIQQGIDDPLAILEEIKLEMIASDQQLLQNWIQQQGDALGNDNKSQMHTWLTQIEQNFFPEKRSTQFLPENVRVLLVSTKPIMVIANIDLNGQKLNQLVWINFQKYCQEHHLPYQQQSLLLSNKVLNQDLAHTWLGWFQHIPTTLQVPLFYTAGPREIRGWFFTSGMNAVTCAGEIHSDFIKKFIRAEVVNMTQLSYCRIWADVKKKRLMQIKDRRYLVRNNDICHFLIS